VSQQRAQTGFAPDTVHLYHSAQTVAAEMNKDDI
jgi:hypothetical protein